MWVGIIGLLVGLTYGLVYYFAVGTAVGAAALAISGAVAMLAPLVYRQTGSRKAAAHLVIADVIVVLTFTCLVRGGFPVSPLAFLVVIPLLAYYTIGLAAATSWTAISVLVAVGVFLQGSQGWEISALRAEASESTWLAIDLFGVVVLVLSILLIAAAYERRRARAEIEAKHAELMLERSQRLESVGRLAAGVAHDFNNLLSVITGTASLLQHKLDLEPGDPIKEELDRILKVCASAAELTSELLVFSNREVSAGHPNDPNRIIESLRGILSRSLREDIHLELNLRSTAQVRIDSARLEQALLNLVINAQDAMSEGGSLEISTADELDPSGERWVAIRVVDTGEGMSPEVAERALEPFFTTKPRGRGTGLGLAMVYGTIGAAGGSISLDSVPGGGTTVSLRLPALRAEAAEALEAPETGRLEAPAPDLEPAGVVPAASVELDGTTVLVVEDDPDVRETLAANLEEWGLSVLTAEDGATALERLQRSGADIDLVLTDVVMPRMSGAELGARLEDLAPDLPVLYMSGYTDIGAERIPREALIAKPFDLDELRHRIGEAVGPWQRRAGG